jgi:hypothetical protein
MRKPTREQVSQDRDSFEGYQGGIATLLLAVGDADLKFLYIRAGAPAYCASTLRQQAMQACLAYCSRPAAEP